MSNAKTLGEILGFSILVFGGLAG